ncbi:hypothetical protein A2223_01430 [Candidatus Falkowbacteria bacterium RIFOXYA2_FULL_35_8]|uniref:2TM domain-containing protein n=1 Tax=Candidatus Falkowbacteria bacterium RIFOXYC2_FULL_36_12 TaxID=1798002 RepID=A0A1F5SZT3_9BACT|nr:MAG: hypothetical protein A2478_02780 [Candidatus Falkowbacteria bacterium RIFOXYC2_FULL_36_12]OGF33221.1 MAG: hypothetical protein A2223_01430 [Candidatus Falkowbacteria bacterium RIFOXYA2_FULL_35_8]
MRTKEFLEVFKTVQNQKIDKERWKQEKYEKRWQNLFMTILFCAVVGLLFFLALNFRSDFSSAILWWIWMVFSGLLIVLGIITVLHYLYIIIRGRY